MKGIIKIAGIFSLLFVLASCTVHHHHGRRVPPGHAKKMYGGSARYYAPGQVKKRGYYQERQRPHRKHGRD
ncbi:hypothetical protein [Chryseobacterium sp. CT-SW4]|uniref:hypothetical protein n=1 Tax=Chryseobacterium sp. SW-1 TaxID=3157343 RepID=UPI003B026BCA